MNYLGYRQPSNAPPQAIQSRPERPSLVIHRGQLKLRIELSRFGEQMGLALVVPGRIDGALDHQLTELPASLALADALGAAPDTGLGETASPGQVREARREAAPPGRAPARTADRRRTRGCRRDPHHESIGGRDAGRVCGQRGSRTTRARTRTRRRIARSGERGRKCWRESTECGRALDSVSMGGVLGMGDKKIPMELKQMELREDELIAPISKGEDQREKHRAARASPICWPHRWAGWCHRYR